MSQTSINVPTNRRVDLEQDSLSITTTDADLTPVYNSLSTNLGLIGDNANSISSLRTDLTSNVASITANQGSITQVASDLASNVLSITNINGSISTINGSLSSHQASLSSHALSLTSHQNSINTLSGSVSTNRTDITALQGSVSAHQTDITGLQGSVSAHDTSITALSGSVSGLSGRLDNLSYTDLNGTIPNEDVAVKELGADKTFYNTGAKAPIGGSTYPTDSLGLELDYQNRNFFDLISSTYALASMAGAINTAIGDPLSITSIASIVAEQVVQNERLFDLDAPVSGRVAVNEDAISTLSSSVGILETRTTGLDRVGTISTISGDLSVSGSIVNSGFTYVEDSVGVLQAKTTEITYDDLNTITSITNNVYVGNDLTVDGTLTAATITNAELQQASTDIDALETKTQDISYAGGTTTIANKTNAQFDFLRLTNMETDDLPPTDNNYVNLGFDRNIGTQADRPAFFYKDHDDQSIAYLIDTHNAGYLDGYQFPASVIPNLPANRITSGTLDVDRIPNLDASKITSGTFNVNRIPNLDASKITGNQLILSGQALGAIQTDAILDLAMNGASGFSIFSDASDSFNFKINDRLSGITRFQINTNGLITMNVGRGSVYFENNSNDNADGSGLTLRTSDNPSNTGGSIFSVRSSGQAARLWVGQDITSVPNNKFGAGDYTGGTGNEGTISNYSFQIDGTSGNVDMTNGRMSVRYNTDTISYLGRSAIGGSSIYSDFAWFSHIDRVSAGNHALLQASNGRTFLNASSSRTIYFTIANASKAELNSAEFRSFVSTKLNSYLMIGTGGDDAGATTGGLSRKNLFITNTYNGASSSNWGWWIGAQNQAQTTTDNDLYFTVKRNGVENTSAYIQDNANNVRMNFTGQHRTFVNGVPYEETETFEGMIVVADTNEYIRMTGGIAKGLPAITTNESLPVVSLSSNAFDKKCFGVISSAEDPDTRVDKHGNFGSIFTKESGDTRVYINSVGEGAIWIVNTNGNLESGDYITTSNVAGYGMKQDDDILHNYTVAKITMDCDFNPPMRPVQVILKDAEGNNILDEYNQIQFVDDPNGSTEPAYLTRVFEDGTVGAFVGCTYHCG